MRASRPSLLLRLRDSRRTSLTVFGVSLGALLVAAIWFTSARSDLAEAYGLVGSRQQALAAANQRMQEAQLRVKLADGAGELLARAEGEGLVEQAWGERLINVSQAPLTRQEVNDLLAGVARSEGRIFGAEAFELSVTRADEGLFDMPGQRTPPLLLTLRGTLLFRTQVPGIAGGAP